DEQGQLISEALKFPVIVAGDSLPQGAVGATWGDPVVTAAAQIAALFGDAWEACGLFKIAPAPGATAGGVPVFHLTARNGSQVIWGAAPEDQPKSLAEAQTKVSKLLEYVQQHRPFDAGAKPVEIDLRSAE